MKPVVSVAQWTNGPSGQGSRSQSLKGLALRNGTPGSSSWLLLPRDHRVPLALGSFLTSRASPPPSGKTATTHMHLGHAIFVT